MELFNYLLVGVVVAIALIWFFYKKVNKDETDTSTTVVDPAPVVVQPNNDVAPVAAAKPKAAKAPAKPKAAKAPAKPKAAKKPKMKVAE